MWWQWSGLILSPVDDFVVIYMVASCVFRGDLAVRVVFGPEHVNRRHPLEHLYVVILCQLECLIPVLRNLDILGSLIRELVGCGAAPSLDVRVGGVPDALLKGLVQAGIVSRP